MSAGDTIKFRGHIVKIIRVAIINGVLHFYVPVPGIRGSYAMIEKKDFDVA